MATELTYRIVMLPGTRGLGIQLLGKKPVPLGVDMEGRMVMPECVKALLALADKSANTLPSADHNGDDFAEAAEAVRKYYGEGGE